MGLPRLVSEYRTGDAITAGEFSITPVAHHIRLLFQGHQGAGGFILNRPVAVRVRGMDGGLEVIPVRNLTRWAQTAAMAAGALVGLSLWLSWQSSRR